MSRFVHHYYGCRLFDINMFSAEQARLVAGECQWYGRRDRHRVARRRRRGFADRKSLPPARVFEDFRDASGKPRRCLSRPPGRLRRTRINLRVWLLKGIRAVGHAAPHCIR